MLIARVTLFKIMMCFRQWYEIKILMTSKFVWDDQETGNADFKFCRKVRRLRMGLERNRR